MEIAFVNKIDVCDFITEINKHKAEERESFLLECLNQVEWYSENEEMTLTKNGKKELHRWLKLKLEWLESIM